MKNSIGVSEYMLFTKSFSEIKNLNSLGSIEERKEKYDGLGSVAVSYTHLRAHETEADLV